MLSCGNRSNPAAERTPGNGVLAANTRSSPVCHRQLPRSRSRLLRYFLRYRSALSQSSHEGQPVQWILGHWAQGGDRPGGRGVLGGDLGELSAACGVGDLGDLRGPQAGRASGSGRRSSPTQRVLSVACGTMYAWLTKCARRRAGRGSRRATFPWRRSLSLISVFRTPNITGACSGSSRGRRSVSLCTCARRTSPQSCGSMPMTS